MSERLPISLRNLFRNPRRTGLALSAIVFGVTGLLLAEGFVDWIFWAMRESAIKSRLGHIQVTRAGYSDAGQADPFAYLLPERSRDLEQIETMDGIEVVAPRLVFSGLVSLGDTTIPFLGEGVSPQKEEVLSKFMHIKSGKGLSALSQDGVILGMGLANSLGAEVGDAVTLLSNTSSGGINAVELTVTGIFYTSTKMFDDSVLRVSVSTARQLLRLSGSHAWILLLERTSKTKQVVEQLEAAAVGFDTSLQFTTWMELATFYNKTVDLFSSQMNVVWLIIMIIFLLSTANVLVMTVLDRTSEIGTLMAIGFKRWKILSLFVTEGTLLGLIGGAIGACISLILADVISVVGIPMPPPPGMEVGFKGEIHLSWQLVSRGVLLAVVTAFLASLYPAWKASHLEIVDALRRSR